MSVCLLSLGSNLGDRAQNLDRAIHRLDQLPTTRVIARSQFHSTRPVGGPSGQDEFLNGCVLVETSLDPESLLEHTLRVEQELGRTREQRWSARTIDIDLLLFDALIFASPNLVLPHRRMRYRRFVLNPAVEVAPEMLDPITQWSVRELHAWLDTGPNNLALAGGPQELRSRVAHTAAGDLGCKLVTVPQSSQSVVGNTDSAPHEILRRQLAVLESASITTGVPDVANFVISDFWIGDAVDSKVLLKEAALSEKFLIPKLLVVCGEEASNQFSTASASGPTLVLNTLDEQTLIDEVTAAVRAMQP